MVNGLPWVDNGWLAVLMEPEVDYDLHKSPKL